MTTDSMDIPGARERMYKRIVLTQWGKSQLGWYTSRLWRGMERYQEVERLCGVPAEIVGVIHGLECGFKFDRHLHNGDPLKAKTIQVPRGRPLADSWTWETSAVDALAYDKLTAVDWSDIEAGLYALERYNGLGYLKYHPGVNTPYLWSGSQWYSRGKYVQDGKWSDTAVSGQIGAAVLLHATGWNMGERYA